MRVHCLGNAGAPAVALHELLDAARCEAGVPLRLEQVKVLWMSLQVAFQDEAEAGWKQYVAVLRPLALTDEHLALLKINVFNTNAHQLAHPHGGVEQELQHDLVLDVAAVLDHSEEALERRLAQQFGSLRSFLGVLSPS